MKRQYEYDSQFDGAFTVDGYKGVAWYVWGWEIEPDQDTEWSGLYNHTGNVVATMVGDDRHFVFDIGEIHKLDESEYCHSCGQTGCKHNIGEN